MRVFFTQARLKRLYGGAKKQLKRPRFFGKNVGCQMSSVKWRMNRIDHFHEAFFVRGRGLQSTQLETVEAEARMEGVGS